MSDVIVRDVTLRDGFQDESPLPTDTKVAVFEALVDAGVGEVELTSFVRPDRVPAMADAEELATRSAGSPTRRWGLVLNERGAQRALACGIDHLQFVVSVSDAHSHENAGYGSDAAMRTLEEVAAIAADREASIEITLATAFGCPFEGRIAAGRVLALAERAASIGVSAISLADTIGVGAPTEVRMLVGSLVGDRAAIGVHLHDTRGLGLANALTAIDAGAQRVDAAVGGLGGCPFSPGASGNLATEDLVHALDAVGVRTGIDIDRLIAASRLACDSVGRPVRSHVGVAGPRFGSPSPR